MNRESLTPSPAASIRWADKSAQLRQDGYCVIPQVLSSDFVARLSAAADQLGVESTKKAGDVWRAQGSMVGIPDLTDPVFGELIASAGISTCFDSLGLDDAAFTAGFVISKPPRSPRLFWHFDWYQWEDPCSYEPEPRQLFAMYYLTDTSPENGCLRVIPGSHLTRHPLHDCMKDGHLELSNAKDLSRPEFADWPEEVPVPVKAGDVVLGDARLLHAAHANQTDARRSLITLWYHPHFSDLPERVQATIRSYVHQLPETWPEEIRAAVTDIHPKFQGNAVPLARTTHGPKPSARSRQHAVDKRR